MIVLDRSEVGIHVTKDDDV